MAKGSGLRRMLVPLDGSALAEHAIPYAAALASRGAAVVLFQVVLTPGPKRDLIGRVKLESEAVADEESSQSRDELQEIARRYAPILPGETRSEVAVGEPASEIVKAAQRLSCDLIVAASHGRGAVARLAFGSVADQLTRTSTVPIMIVRSKDAPAELVVPAIGRVMVPYDGSELAEEAFPVAIELARQLNASVHLIRVVTPTAYGPATAIAPMEPYPTLDLTDIFDEIEAEAKTSLELAASKIKAAGVPTSYELLDGSPVEGIVERAHPDDLIVMTSHGRSGFRRWLLGSVAEKLVREGPVPVVLVPAAARAADEVPDGQ